jgi:acetyltransferase-like isoleucine patch superfamily enzyme
MFHSAQIDVSYRALLNGKSPTPRNPTSIHSSVSMGQYVLVGSGCAVEEGCVLDHFTWIENGVRIGAGTLVTYRAHIANDVMIGSACVIGGYLGEFSRIGDQSRVFGSLVHRHAQTNIAWDDEAAAEAAPVLGARVFVGFGAVIVGGVTIGDDTYIAANAVVTKSIPAGKLVVDTNRVFELSEWRGTSRNSMINRQEVSR